MKVNEWLGSDGTQLPTAPKTAAETVDLRRRLDAQVGEIERRRIMAEIATRALFAANPGLQPGFLIGSDEK